MTLIVIFIGVFVADSSPALLRHNTSSAANIRRLHNDTDRQSVGVRQGCDRRDVGVHQMSAGRPLLTRSNSDVTADSVRMSALSDSATIDTSQLSADIRHSRNAAAAAVSFIVTYLLTCSLNNCIVNFIARNLGNTAREVNNTLLLTSLAVFPRFQHSVVYFVIYVIVYGIRLVKFRSNI